MSTEQEFAGSIQYPARFLDDDPACIPGLVAHARGAMKLAAQRDGLTVRDDTVQMRLMTYREPGEVARLALHALAVEVVLPHAAFVCATASPSIATMWAIGQAVPA